ncbi:hypothetical protein [Aminobacter niigataensis]|uniref:hypothetical protein n=1 Tax=Aminobacter niigataensis TaxID=83265 RepID=UPI0024C54FD9|nr:hypothetical protein [Aminobacter niigataensis]CAI2936257.1 conserved protein of unknown function [Aminobacter niigataensis]
MSSNHVVKLVPKSQEHRDGVVKTLKNMLEIAERGDLLGIAIAAVDNEGCTQSAFEPGISIATLIGANERLKHRLLEYRDGDV